jgi:hypothetical protein
MMTMSTTLITSRDSKGQQTFRLLEAAYDKMGLDAEQAQRLNERGDELVSGFKELLGNLAAVAVGDVVDCDADASIPSGYNWTIERHIKGGKVRLERRGDNLYVDGKKIVLHLVKRQTGNGVVQGYELRKELENGKLVLLNANILDYLLDHPEMIPDSWKGKAIFFWGTVYRSSDGDLRVRCLYWDGGRWGWHCGWLGLVWCFSGPAAVLASV